MEILSKNDLNLFVLHPKKVISWPQSQKILKYIDQDRDNFASLRLHKPMMDPYS